ncbi:MAG TPA: sigma-70 family RNA polymerase sigma factor [Verrucomicrobiae bacterium]|nr:sigma-70 family RNA polymerase sigma factor [Verrucomicrobiae bacterium]
MELHGLTDFQVVERIQSGDDSAFDELMHRYKRPVVNFIYRMLGDACDADDLAQEVFVRVYRHLGEYKPRAKFSTWLFALAHNAALDRLRWRARHPTESLDSVPEPAAVPREIQTREIGEHIAAAVAQLPEDQRTAIVLAEYHGMSYAEIGAIMRCSEKSVESRLYRAKQTLRERLRLLLE